MTERLVEFTMKRLALEEEENGTPLRDHLEQVEKQTGKTPEELDLPELTEMEMHVWRKFVSIQSGRTYGINGPNPLGFQDIVAWRELTGWEVSPWELNVIKRLDAEIFKSKSSKEA